MQGSLGWWSSTPRKSQIVLPRLLTQGHRFDMAIVDGNHRFDAVFVDLPYLGRLLRAGGTVFPGDYQLPGVAHATSFFTANLGWGVEETSSADHRHHWAVLRTSTGPDTGPSTISPASDHPGPWFCPTVGRYGCQETAHP
jgi:hypothetical protein